MDRAADDTAALASLLACDSFGLDSRVDGDDDDERPDWVLSSAAAFVFQ